MDEVLEVVVETIRQLRQSTLPQPCPCKGEEAGTHLPPALQGGIEGGKATAIIITTHNRDHLSL
ncbi:hypothetical protein QUB80_01640 [Chlorogloeopsis sp. ULAP01]|uniref:hypothetical protein n=1 Tax=Chlorogloeopsis sp. ULAP01 TaxID=3056483 RepID=UPI0025AA6D52|nr:hypothetical protein [Chlorogloeopsis sp. ULAP01]MDM9379409.1 hypothetical protein [Chlorogloeopsis sp. ULAP01]